MPDLSAVLGVVIAIIFVFLLLSLIATWFQELLAALLSWRSKELMNAIGNLLDPSIEKLDGVEKVYEKWEEGGDQTLVAKLEKNPLKAFYEHPLIDGLSKPGKYPSYIDTKEFGTALFDLLATAGTDESAVKMRLKSVRQGIDKMPNEITKNALQALIDSAVATAESADKRLGDARQAVEDWFDSAMERASGWYKRFSQRWALAIGLVLAILVNADAISLTQAFWQDAALRDTVSAAAVAYVERGEEANAKEARAELADLDLPIGWSLKLADTDPATPEDPREFPRSFGGWLVKIFGVLITGFAISQGAPLWFDLLSKVVNMRNSGGKPQVAAAQ